jgi:hypothetical protein
MEMVKGNKMKLMKHNILTNHPRMTKGTNNHRRAVVWALSKNRLEIS